MELSNDTNAATYPEFPYAFTLKCKVTVSNGSLEQELLVNNLSPTDSFQFTTALHTYFRLKHGAESVTIHGLKNVRYLDSLQGRKECTEESEDVKLVGEVDRIYCGVPDTVRIIDGGGSGDGGILSVSGSSENNKMAQSEKQRILVIEKNGFPDAVLWNPHVVKASKMKDFGDDEWKDRVCVEVAQAGSGKIEVGPGGSWIGRQKISSTDE